MPENAPRRKHQYGGVLLRKGLARKEQAAPSTPPPSWKLYENPSFHTVAAMAMAAATGLMEREEGEDEDYAEDNEQAEGKTVSTWKRLQEGPAPIVSFLSARKLAAALRDEFQEEGQSNSSVAMCDILESSPCSHLQQRPSSLSNSESPDSNPTKQSGVLKSSPSPLLKVDTLTSARRKSWSSSSTSKAADLCSIASTEDSPEDHGGLLDKYDTGAGPVASSNGYLKAFSRFSLETTKQDNSLVESTYSEDLSRALTRVQQVEAAHISARKEVDGLLRRCADEITMLRTKEQEKVQAAVFSIAEELEVEREARKNAEMESKRLANCVEDAKKTVVVIEKELEKQRKSRQLMEDVCNELAREIGEDKTEVEELKRELAKARDEIEEERQVLRVTEAWREERVQMKLAEAKLELEERCIALDQLKVELESVLRKQRVHRAGRSGRSQERAIMKRLQEEAIKSAIFQEDARFQFSSDDNASSQHNSRSNNAHSSLFRKAYNRKYIRPTVYSSKCNESDLDRNGNASRLARETCDWLESTNAQLNEQRHHHCKQSSSRSRNKASIRSYQSKVKGLSTLGGRDIVQDSSDELDRNRYGIEDSGSQGGSSSDHMFNEQDEEEANWLHGERGIVLWSSNGEGLVCTRKAQNIHMKKNRHGVAKIEQQRQGAAGVEKRYYGVSPGYMPNAESVGTFSSIIRPSPASRGHMPSPDLSMRKPFQTGSPLKHSASSVRRAVYSPSDRVKPYKRNSLQAKLLLEDRLLR